MVRLFVYGTLLADSGTAPAQWLRARMCSAEAGTVPGRLVAISTRRGCYPALVKGTPGERVRGMICDLVLRPGELAQLDRYEGTEYRRVMSRALIASSKRHRQVQLYRRRGSSPREACQIPAGDFLAMLARRGVHVYAERATLCHSGGGKWPLDSGHDTVACAATRDLVPCRSVGNETGQ